jgi:hypothetical protein
VKRLALLPLVVVLLIGATECSSSEPKPISVSAACKEIAADGAPWIGELMTPEQTGAHFKKLSEAQATYGQQFDALASRLSSTNESLSRRFKTIGASLKRNAEDFAAYANGDKSQIQASEDRLLRTNELLDALADTCPQIRM